MRAFSGTFELDMTCNPGETVGWRQCSIAAGVCALWLDPWLDVGDFLIRAARSSWNALIGAAGCRTSPAASGLWGSKNLHQKAVKPMCETFEKDVAARMRTRSGSPTGFKSSSSRLQDAIGMFLSGAAGCRTSEFSSVLEGLEKLHQKAIKPICKIPEKDLAACIRARAGTTTGFKSSW